MAAEEKGQRSSVPHDDLHQTVWRGASCKCSRVTPINAAVACEGSSNHGASALCDGLNGAVGGERPAVYDSAASLFNQRVLAHVLVGEKTEAEGGTPLSTTGCGHFFFNQP